MIILSHGWWCWCLLIRAWHGGFFWGRNSKKNFTSSDPHPDLLFWHWDILSGRSTIFWHIFWHSIWHSIIQRLILGSVVAKLDTVCELDIRRSWRYGVRVQAPTASRARHMAWIGSNLETLTWQVRNNSIKPSPSVWPLLNQQLKTYPQHTVYCWVYILRHLYRCQLPWYLSTHAKCEARAQGPCRKRIHKNWWLQ